MTTLTDVNTVLTNSAVDDIKRLITQQKLPIIFLTELPRSIVLRVVHTITHVTPQLGKTMRLDGKVVGFLVHQIIQHQLFTQDNDHAEVEVGQIASIPFEWATYFLEKDMTPSASLTFVLYRL